MRITNEDLDPEHTPMPSADDAAHYFGTQAQIVVSGLLAVVVIVAVVDLGRKRVISMAWKDVVGLNAETTKLRREVQFLKDDLVRAQFGKMFERVGYNLYTKIYIEKHGDVLVTDNLFCRMVSDGSVARHRPIHLLPDCLFGYAVIKFGIDAMKKETTFCVSSKVVGRIAHREAGSHRVIFSSGASVQITLRTGVPNDRSCV